MSAFSSGTSASCSVDALERIVHFTGAGADACFYANHHLATPTATVTHPGASTEALRYWLNPSVRARPTIATCEITNLGSPFFAPNSAAQLRISTTPLFHDGRCFPRRCVLNLATSTQRLDGVSVRPVVLREWDLDVVNTSEDGSPPVLTFVSAAPRPCITEIPLRTLYHVASLVGASSSETRTTSTSNMDEVRLYLQLRFTGCTDASDTHRISSVRLTYENLGRAAEVLPLLQRRRLRQIAGVYEAASIGNVGGLDTSTFVEEVEVAITGDSSFETFDENGAVAAAAAPHTPLRRAESCLIIPVDDTFDSPPHRSATKSRAEKSSSFDGERVPTHYDPYQCTGFSCETRGEEKSNGEQHSDKSAELVRVERVLRLPPPPPLSLNVITEARIMNSAPNEEPVLLREAPWPPRKTRTIVLAPSISPSMSSASASCSPLSSPGSGTGSNPRSGSSSTVMCAAPTPLTKEVEEKTYPSSAVVVLQPHSAVEEYGASGPDKPSTPSPEPFLREKPSGASTASPPPHQQIEASVDVDYHRAALELFPSKADRRKTSSLPRCVPTPREVAGTRSNPAVLWAATSLLGIAPWKLRSLQSSRRGSPVVSARSSRTSSRERNNGESMHESSSAMLTATAAAPSTTLINTSVSFLPTSRSIEISQKCHPPLKWETTSSSSFMSWREAGEKSAELASTYANATAATSSFRQWQSTFLSDASPHINPQLQPPRGVIAQAPSAAAFSSAISTNPPSAYVPRLNFRTMTTTKREVPTPQSQSNVNVDYRSFAMPARAVPPPPSLPPPSQNRELWTNIDKGTTTKATVSVQNVMAEYNQPCGVKTQKKTSVSFKNAPSRNATSAEADVKPGIIAGASRDAHGLKQPLSVIPASWLHSIKMRSTQCKQRNPADERISREGRHVSSIDPSATAAEDKSLNYAAAAVAAPSSPIDTSLAELSSTAAVPPPPPFPPPPSSRMLFHSTATSLHSSRSSSAASSAAAAAAAAAVPPPPRSTSADGRLASPPTVMVTQRNNSEAPAPTLPLQEEDCQHAFNTSYYSSQRRRRSRSAPDPRPTRFTSPPSTPCLSRLNNSPAKEKEMQVFAVLKHHASRNGVGRRRLTIRPVSPSRSWFFPNNSAAASVHSSNVRFFLALEKVRGVAQLCDAVGFGVRGLEGSSSSTCEIPILWTDVVEVWTGVQAYNSGVIHKNRVRDSECCLVIRCNRQLVTAVEMDSLEAVNTVSRLLRAKN